MSDHVMFNQVWPNGNLAKAQAFALKPVAAACQGEAVTGMTRLHSLSALCDLENPESYTLHFSAPSLIDSSGLLLRGLN